MANSKTNHSVNPRRALPLISRTLCDNLFLKDLGGKEVSGSCAGLHLFPYFTVLLRPIRLVLF